MLKEYITFKCPECGYKKHVQFFKLTGDANQDKQIDKAAEEKKTQAVLGETCPGCKHRGLVRVGPMK
jgi:DNA-directed RNA polymerase subunit RPC12/RpoP